MEVKESKLPVLGFCSHNPKTAAKYTGSREYIAHHCFSNWAFGKFTMDGKVYFSTEQRMMEQKALLFGDEIQARRIMSTTFGKHFNFSAPEKWREWSQIQQEIKSMGRHIANFDQEKWKECREEIVYQANLEKFRQNSKFKETLLSTENLILAEASPYDKIWGIGLTPSHPNVQNPDLWNGINLLGKCLMKVRETLQQEQENFTA